MTAEAQCGSQSAWDAQAWVLLLDLQRVLPLPAQPAVVMDKAQPSNYIQLVQNQKCSRSISKLLELREADMKEIEDFGLLNFDSL